MQILYVDTQRMAKIKVTEIQLKIGMEKSFFWNTLEPHWREYRAYLGNHALRTVVLLQCTDHKNGEYFVVNQIIEACWLEGLLAFMSSSFPHSSWFPL